MSSCLTLGNLSQSLVVFLAEGIRFRGSPQITDVAPIPSRLGEERLVVKVSIEILTANFRIFAVPDQLVRLSEECFTLPRADVLPFKVSSQVSCSAFLNCVSPRASNNGARERSVGIVATTSRVRIFVSLKVVC